MVLLCTLALVPSTSGSEVLSTARQDALSTDASLGRVVDREGIARRRPVLAGRWSAAEEHARIEVGDWFETGARGANALALHLRGGTELVLGPGGLLEVDAADRVTLTRGELEVRAADGATLTIVGPQKMALPVRGRAFLRARDGRLTRLEDEPDWLTGYRGNASTEALGSLLVDIDGRNEPLTMGYHQVTVDVRDQIARTVIEESFVNHTHTILEGVFYFPLPADASISGFGMWIGDQLVQGEIVEKQRAREIYETILRERRDPGLLEWAGGSIFKARVFPIGLEKRIRISYTQVLAKRGDGYGYRYALQSELLRKFPLARLRIQVDVQSSETLAEVSSPSHDCRIQLGEHAARVEFEAAEYSPDRDFELRVLTAAPAGGLTAVPHRRGDDGYFMLLVDPPELARRAAASDEALDLLVLADTSGSMWGAPREQQLVFLETLLGSLGERDTFQLATVDVEVDFASERAQRNTPAAREAALDLVAGREPLGWTDLDRAFRAAFERAGPNTAVVYVGDGASTSGDPDPAAFARRVARLYRGRGSVHAVVPGSSSEPLALQAMAALGGGSLRTIGSDGDASDAAFELLGELTHPAVVDLRVEFEGIEVAAVYPERLPNLVAGRQQRIFGRFDPLAGDLAGRVRVLGTLDGAPVELIGELRLAADDEGNSFVPRLWARHHLDHLLAQGSSREVRDSVIALSEDFQIATPYTSFLVLESDADRERFGVEQRLRMRDGEEFFAAGRDAARHELTRRQMRAAKSWRVGLRARVLAGLTDLERARVELLRDPDVTIDALSALNGLGYVRGESGREKQLLASREMSDPGAGGPAVPDGDDSAGDFLADGPPEEPEELHDLAEPLLAKSARDGDYRGPSDTVSTGSDEFFLGRGERGQSRSGPASPGAWGPARARHRTSREVEALSSLFPHLPEPPAPPAQIRWPKEVRKLLDALDRSAAIAAAGRGGFEFTTQTHSQLLRSPSGPVRNRHVLSRGAWAQHMGGQLSWCRGEERGVISLGWDLGRTRTATEADAQAWMEPMTWWFGSTLRAYLGHFAELEDLGRGLVRVRLTHERSPDSALELVVERERALLLEQSWTRAGEVLSRSVYGDFREIGGVWWPGSSEAIGEGGLELSRTSLTVETLAPETLAERLDELLAVRGRALVLREAPRDPQAAKQAERAGEATLEQRFELLLHFAESQRGDALDVQLAAFETLAGDVPGRRIVRMVCLQLVRRGEELRRELTECAAWLAGAAREGELAMAGRMLQLAQDLGTGTEQLELLVALRPIYDRHAHTPDARLVWDQRRLAAFEALQRFEAAFEQRRAMAERYTYQVQVQADLARTLALRGELDRALEHLTEVEEQRGPWSSYERGVLRGTRLDLLWNGYRLEELVQACAGWLAEAPESLDVNVAARHLSALTFLDREDEARALARAWLAPSDGEALSQGRRARVQAALQHLSGQVYATYRWGALEADRAEEIARTLRRLAHDDATLDLAGPFARNHGFAQSDAGRAFLDELRTELEAGVETLSVARLRAWVQWLHGRRNDKDSATADLARWTAFCERAFVR
ncbi:MAG TPA: VIT domain-containing protein, partial [Planctomycetota bacterium]|nr:VIT domain-containing protein [Planctomycetota bacterium]